MCTLVLILYYIVEVLCALRLNYLRQKHYVFRRALHPSIIHCPLTPVSHDAISPYFLGGAEGVGGRGM